MRRPPHGRRLLLAGAAAFMLVAAPGLSAVDVDDAEIGDTAGLPVLSAPGKDSASQATPTVPGSETLEAAPGRGVAPSALPAGLAIRKATESPLRRYEIIAVGGVPIALFYTNMGFDLMRYLQNSFDAQYAPWPFSSSTSAGLSDDERLTRLAVAAMASFGIAGLDALATNGDLEPFAKVLATPSATSPSILVEPGLRVLLGPARPGLRPVALTQVPILVYGTEFAPKALSLNFSFGAQGELRLGRLILTPLLAGGLTFAFVSAADAVATQAVGKLSHLGAELLARFSVYSSNALGLYLETGLEYWLAVSDSYLDYGGIGLGFGAEVNLRAGKR